MQLNPPCNREALTNLDESLEFESFDTLRVKKELIPSDELTIVSEMKKQRRLSTDVLGPDNRNRNTLFQGFEPLI